MNSAVTPKTDSADVKPLWLADFSLLLVAIIWGVNIPIMKVALLKIDAYAFNAIRLIVSSIVLLYFARREFLRGIRPASSLSKRAILFYAFMVSVAYQLLFLLAVSRATSADVALIMATVPMWTAIGARFFLKEILPLLAWIGLIIAFAGTMIVTLQKTPRPIPASPSGTAEAASNIHPADTDANSSLPSEHHSVDSLISMKAPHLRIGRATGLDALSQDSTKVSHRLAGNLLALSAALAWAGGTVFSRTLLGRISPIQLSACSATLGLPFHIVIALLIGRDPILVSAVATKDPSLIACVLYSGILSTGLALAMWSYGVKLAGAAHAAMIQNLTPIVAMAAAWIWLGETINLAQAFGGSLIIGGLFIMRRSR
jgi:drug/metabolite transporter (DMT)-like permease